MSKAVHGFNLYHLSTRRRVWPAQTAKRQPCKKCLKCGEGIFCHLHKSGPVSCNEEGWTEAWDTYVCDPKLQEQWKAKAAMVNAREFIIPSIFRQADGYQAWMSPFTPLLRAKASPARCAHEDYWANMTRKEQDEWYLKEKEPLMLAMTAQRTEMLLYVSKHFNELPDGVLEIIAFHMANEAWKGLVLFRDWRWKSGGCPGF